MKKWIRYGVAFGFVVVMFAVSQATGEREIVFPEILAVALGALCMERQPWRASRPLMVLLMTGSAFLGVGVVRFVPLPLLGQALIGFGFVAICLILTDCSLAPMISACILPMYLGTETMVYPLSVAVMMLVLVLIQWALERSGLRPAPQRFSWRKPTRGIFCAWGVAFAGFALLETAALTLGKVYLMVPPLIVTWVEGCFHDWNGRRMRILASVVGSACVGIAARLLLGGILGWPIVVCGAIAAALLLALSVLLRSSFPPACAVGLLPFLLPQEGIGWYPVLTAAGCGVILLLTRFVSPIVAKWLTKDERRGNTTPAEAAINRCPGGRKSRLD